MTKRKGHNFNPYFKSRQNLCSQHVANVFKSDTAVAGFITSSDSTIVEGSVDRTTLDESEVTTGVIEFKKVKFLIDQTLAEMLCTLTDCALEQLKKGKQIKKVIVYRLAVNYQLKKSKVYKLTLNYVSNSSDVWRLRDEVTLCKGINFMVAALKY